MATGDIVATAAEAEGLAKPPLLVLDRVRGFLDERGLGSGAVRARRIGEGGGSNFTFLLERDDGELLRLRIDQTAMTLPSPGERVRVQYQNEGTQPSAVSIEKSEQMP